MKANNTEGMEDGCSCTRFVLMIAQSQVQSSVGWAAAL